METADFGYVPDSGEEDVQEEPKLAACSRIASMFEGSSMKRRRTSALVEGLPTSGAAACATGTGDDDAPELETPPKLAQAARLGAAPAVVAAEGKPPAPLVLDTHGTALEEDDGSKVAGAAAPPEEGYTLRDLRRIVDGMLPRYGHLLSQDEHKALSAFAKLPVRAQQLYARLLGRKWPQWISVQGLGSKYRELVEDDAALAMQELMADGPLAAVGRSPPWLLDSATETPATLVARQLRLALEGAASPERLQSCGEGQKELNYGTLLLEALPMAQLKLLSTGLGIVRGAKSSRETKSAYLSNLCRAARAQRLLTGLQASKAEDLTDEHPVGSTMEIRMVERALSAGRWVCVSPSVGRAAVTMLIDLFHLESRGSPESLYMVMTTKWPKYDLQPSSVAKPLFNERSVLNEYLLARRLNLHFEADTKGISVAGAAESALLAENKLREALSSLGERAFEVDKAQSPFRRRHTVAWCWVEALHHAVMRMPGLGKDDAPRVAKVRQLELLLQSRLCISRRGRWYNELAKEVLRVRDVSAALVVATEGLAEGEPAPITAVVKVDLVSEPAASQEVVDPLAAALSAPLPLLPRDARWELARRCHALARRADAERLRRAPRGGRRAAAPSAGWRRLLRETPAARAKARGGDDEGRWLPSLVERLVAEEAAAAGPVKCISASSMGLPIDQDGGKGSGKGGRRLFAGHDLADLSVEELALRHYFENEGFACGVHSEGALLRDLFGILLFNEMFDTSVDGVFVSEFQDAPLDLGTEVFYTSRQSRLDLRLRMLSCLCPRELAAEVHRCFAAAHGTRIHGVNWQRYEGPCGTLHTRVALEGAEVGGKEAGRRILWTCNDQPLPQEARGLGALAGAIGGSAISAALRCLCEDYNASGLPDLIVWTWDEGRAPRARFVEVKSERDTLARRQRLWLSTLRSAGVEAEICHVRDGPTGTAGSDSLVRPRLDAGDIEDASDIEFL